MRFTNPNPFQQSKSNASGVKQPIAGSTAKDAKSTAGQVAHTTVTMGSPPDSPLKRHQMPKKRTVRLEMDTTKTDRHEWVVRTCSLISTFLSPSPLS